ncbi:hypothetical protein BMS3Bbin06_01908 [bacterium BMS3Bbin06]|nr:hypothetical protein BMS3Abin08_00649 [bacterium BMS3Abin08]GBE35369.1 hypothetical protein BMS3Bbin06_01908 [bacterium BMS3Bbin06]HDO36333.1 hypothetical protein [Nitrospirota bacterium]
MTPIDEPVVVVASFAGGERVRPIKFRWGDRVIHVKEITYRWTKQEGKRKLYLFSLTDGRTLYNISFDPAGLIWRLEGLETDI